MTKTTISKSMARMAGLAGAILGATLLAVSPAQAQTARATLQPISKVIKPAGVSKVGACVVNRSLSLFPSGGVVFPIPLTQGVNSCGSGGLLGLPKALPSKGGPVNSTSGFTESFTIMNTGNLALAVGNVFVDSIDANLQYDVIGCSNISIAPGQSCSGLIEFCAYPAEPAGSKPSTLRVFSNAAGSPHTLPVSGSIAPGVPPPPAPIYSRSPNSVNFPPVPPGVATGPEVVTVSNLGNAPLTVISANPGPGFTVTANTCGVVAGGSSCTISVIFDGSLIVPSTFSTNLDILWSPGSGSTTDSVGLFAETVPEPGVLVQPGLAPPTITNPLYPDLEPGQSHPITLKFKNLSASTITLSSVGYITTPSGAFSIQNDLCTGSVIPTGNFCFVDVVFDATSLPFNTSFPYSDVIRFSDGTTDWDVTASGYIIPPYPQLAISPNFHDFGTVVAPGSSACQDFVVQNVGSATYSFFIVSPGAPFNAGCTPGGPEPACTASDVVSQTLAPGTACRVARRFSPVGDIFAVDYISIVDGNSWWGTPAYAELQGTGVAPGPRIFLSSQVMTFGAHPVGSAAPQQTVTLTNTGDAPLNISSVVAPILPFTLSENCVAASPLAVGNSCIIHTDFTPPAISLYSSNVNIISDAVNGNVIPIAVDGEGVGAPQASADFFPMTVSFGNQNIGSSSGFVAIPFANTGSAPMSIMDIQLIGTDAGEFSMSHDCPVGAGTLAVNDCCTLQVRFQPVTGAVSPTPRTASIEIQSDATNPIVSIPVDGVAVPPPSLTSSPPALTFPDQIELTTSASSPVIITNTGVTLVTLTVISSSGEFTVVPPVALPGLAAPKSGGKSVPAGKAGAKGAKVFLGDCTVGANLLPGDSCQVNLTFSPSSAGARSGSLAIAFTGGVGSPFVMPLAGSGTPPFFPAIGVSTDLLDFGNVVVNTGAQRAVVVTSTGSGALAVTGVRTLQPIFTASTSCTTAQAPGTSCSVTVTCLPTALGKQEGDLYIDHNASGGFRYVKLACEGVPTPVPKIELSLTGITFGSASLGSSTSSQRVTIRSVGSAPLTIRNIASLAPFSATNTCPAILQPGEFCFADVTYTANGPGRQLGELAVGSDDPAKPTAIVELAGTGCRPPSVQNNRRPGVINLCAP